MNACVVLVSPRNPLNIGAAARAMSNFGFFDLRLVDAYKPSLEEARSAVNAGEVMQAAREFPSLAEAIADCTLVVGTTSAAHRELHHRLVRLEHAAGELTGENTRTALLFGSEKFGLGNDHLSYCNFLVRIPSREQHRSMNLGQAVAVTLYELVRNEAPSAAREHPRATQAALTRLEELVFEALEGCSYARTPVTEEKIRRAILRLDISPHDASVWQGIFRQILWRLRDNRQQQ